MDDEAIERRLRRLEGIVMYLADETGLGDLAGLVHTPEQRESFKALVDAVRAELVAALGAS